MGRQVGGDGSLFYIPTAVLGLFQGLTEYPWLVMLFIGIFYIIVGMWLESIPQIIIFTAVFFPLITSLGIDPVVFGVFTVLTCEIGFLTPPIGVILYCCSKNQQDHDRGNFGGCSAVAHPLPDYDSDACVLF